MAPIPLPYVPEHKLIEIEGTPLRNLGFQLASGNHARVGPRETAAYRVWSAEVNRRHEAYRAAEAKAAAAEERRSSAEWERRNEGR